jgi:uncharacterized protein (TIRG00374 family)
MSDLNKDRKKRLKKLLFGLKVPFTVGLCIVILINADWGKIGIAVQNARIGLIVLVFAGMLLSIAVSALKWKIILSIHGINFSVVELKAYILIGCFFNNFLPGMIGGDAYRIYKTIQTPYSKTGALLSVLNERIFGIMTLLFLGFCGAIISFTMNGDKISKLGILFGGFGLLISFLLISFFSNKKIRWWTLKKQRIPQTIKRFVEHLGDYRWHKGRFFRFILVSILFYILSFLNWLIIIYAFGESCSIFSLAMMIMISNVVAQLPISLNGIGLLDGSLIYLLTHFGVAYESAIMVMILYRMLMIFISFIGAILYFLGKDRRSSYQFRKEELYPVIYTTEFDVQADSKVGTGLSAGYSIRQWDQTPAKTEKLP